MDEDTIRCPSLLVPDERIRRTSPLDMSASPVSCLFTTLQAKRALISCGRGLDHRRQSGARVILQSERCRLCKIAQIDTA
jgi:hypothetical protein